MIELLFIYHSSKQPFMADFLSGEWRNITDDQVNRDIYPLGTYSYMAQLIVIFLITDFVR